MATKPYTDGSDALSTQFKYNIEFFHMPSGESVSFKAFLTNFSDSFEADWGEEEVYGRMDPIMTFQGTKRFLVCFIPHLRRARLLVW